jgi:ribosomal protein S18 acetylase RimI-like enzyme
MTFRRATAADAKALGALHVASWREAYGGLLPAAMLCGLDAAQRAQRWTAILAEEGEGATLLLEDAGGLAGFASVGPQRDAGLAARGYQGELLALYVLRRVQRLGVGSALLRAGAAHLRTHGYSAAALWVLRDNAPARAFYRATGATILATREERRQDASLHEVAMGWDNLGARWFMAKLQPGGD